MFGKVSKNCYGIFLVGWLNEAGEVWVTSFPGPFARACIRLLDAVALSPKRISSYFAISDQVANRVDYFPAKISIQVLYHPTALNFQSFLDVTLYWVASVSHD